MKQLSKLTKNFTRIDNQILQDGSVSIEAKGVYCYLVSLPNDWQFSLKNIAKALSVGEKKLTNIFKELIALNLLKKWYYNDENGYKRLEICLYDYSTRENPTMPKREVGLATQNRDIKNTKPYNKEQILHSQKGVLENTTQNRGLQDMPNTETPLNANENPTMPKGEVGYTIYNTKKESNKEILQNNKKVALQENKKKLLEYAISLYDSDSNLAFSKESWLDWISYKLKRTPKITELAVRMSFKQAKRFGNNAEIAIEHSIAGVYQGLFLPNDIKKQVKQGYNATKGNSGESFFSDNPDDYINPNTPGVKSVNGAIYEVDMFELLGRKD